MIRKFEGDSHESSAHWFGMTRSDDAPNSKFTAPQNDTERVREGTTTDQVRHDLSAATRRQIPNLLHDRTIPSGSGKERPQTRFVTTCQRRLAAKFQIYCTTERYRAGQGRNDHRPGSSRLVSGDSPPNSKLSFPVQGLSIRFFRAAAQSAGLMVSGDSMAMEPAARPARAVCSKSMPSR